MPLDSFDVESVKGKQRAFDDGDFERRDRAEGHDGDMTAGGRRGLGVRTTLPLTEGEQRAQADENVASSQRILVGPQVRRTAR